MAAVRGLPIKTKRLLPGDQFQRTGHEAVYHVFGRFVDHTVLLRVESQPRPHDRHHQAVRSGNAGMKEYLEITTTPSRVLADLIFVDLATGLGYTNVGDAEPIEGFKLDDTVIIISEL